MWVDISNSEIVGSCLFVRAVTFMGPAFTLMWQTVGIINERQSHCVFLRNTLCLIYAAFKQWQDVLYQFPHDKLSKCKKTKQFLICLVIPSDFYWLVFIVFQSICLLRKLLLRKLRRDPYILLCFCFNSRDNL